MVVIEIDKKFDSRMEENNILKWLKQLTKYRKISEFKESIISNYEPKTEESEPEKDFEALVREEAYFISLNNLSMDELIWLLAERELSIEKGYSNVTEDDIRKLAEEINHSGLNYDELCWLNAEVMVMHREHFLE